MEKSLIDDISIKEEDEDGIPILFTNPEIRKMLELADVSSKDIFLDLGCGYGQNLKIALTEFNVKKAIGYENNLERQKNAKNRLKELKRIGILKSRWVIKNDDFDEAMKSNLTKKLLKDVTVVFYGLSPYTGFLNKLNKNLSSGCRLICYYNCLFPEILPIRVDFPFYLHKKPFKKPKSIREWLSTIVQKRKSIFPNKQKPTISELWDELKHDYDVNGDPEDVQDYKIRLEKILKKK